jgi:hypothetical protein
VTDAVALALSTVQTLAGLVVEAGALLRRAPTLTLEEVRTEVAAIRASAAGASLADWEELQRGLREIPTPVERKP